MSVGDVVGIRVVGRYQAQNIVSTMHYEITGQTQGEHEILQTMAEKWDAIVSAAWAARHIDTYTLIGIKAFSKTGANKRPGIVDVGTAGSVVGNECPSPVCRTITLYTDSDNYRRHGRVMLSGCDTAMFDDADGAVTSVERGLMDVLADILVDPIVDDEEAMKPVIPATDVLPIEDITAYLSRKTPSVIRSRRVRGFSIG